MAKQKSKSKSKSKSKLQFSQKMTLGSALFSMLVVVAVLVANFILLWNGKESMSQETVSAISTYGGITSTLTFGGYCALTLGRNMSQNKYANLLRTQTQDQGQG